MIGLPTNRPPTHPGEFLLEDHLRSLGMTQVELAERIGVPIQRVNEIIKGKRGITPDTALRLEAAFGTSAQFWLNAQQAWDLWHQMRAPEAAAIERIRRVVAPRRPAGRRAP